MDPRHLINTYGALQLAAVVTFLLLLHRALRRRGAGLAGHGWLASLCVLGAGIGGRLHYLIEGMVAGRIAPSDFGGVVSPAASGSTFFGAMLGVAAVLVMARRRIPGGSFARLADDAVPAIGVAILIGRLGCLAHGCCLGQPSALPWALPSKLEFGPEAVRLHPLPLYLGLWAVASCWLATALARRVGSRHAGSRPAATRFLFFAALFALGRAAIERLRLAPPEGLAGGSWAGWESLTIAAIAIVVLAARHRSHGYPPMASQRRHAAPMRSGSGISSRAIRMGVDIDGLRPLE